MLACSTCSQTIRFVNPVAMGTPPYITFFLSNQEGNSSGYVTRKAPGTPPPFSLTLSSNPGSQEVTSRTSSSLHCGCIVWRLWPKCCSLAPSCGAPEGDLLHFAQLSQQLLHAMLELRQTGQWVWGFQLPCVVQPALQH